MTVQGTQNQSPQGRTRRVPLLVSGAIAAAAAVLLLAVGGLSLAADGQKDEDGYLTSSGERFSSNGRGLVSENLDVDLDGAESLLDSSDMGKVRLNVTPRTGKPVFVGIARTRDVDHYLDDVAHSLVTDLDLSPFEASYAPRGGKRRPESPAAQRIWAAASHGAGSQTLTWEARDGDWSVVVMNADGSRHVKADISAGAQFGLLDDLGWGALAGGALLLLAAAALIALGAGPPRSPLARVSARRVQAEGIS